MLAFCRVYEHHDDRHCPAEAEGNYGGTHLQAVTLLVAFVTPNSLLPQESGSKSAYACSNLFHSLDTTLTDLSTAPYAFQI